MDANDGKSMGYLENFSIKLSDLVNEQGEFMTSLKQFPYFQVPIPTNCRLLLVYFSSPSKIDWLIKMQCHVSNGVAPFGNSINI